MNNHEHIIKALRRFKTIEPEPTFARTSRALILETKKRNPLGAIFRLPRLAPVLYGGALILLLLTASYLVFVPSKPVVSAAFSPENLTKELANLSINIELREVSYRQSANLAIASALTEIENTSVKHLNQTLLESEEENINLEGSVNPEIDELLNAVIAE